jgi:hypothetical protein
MITGDRAGVSWPGLIRADSGKLSFSSSFAAFS